MTEAWKSSTSRSTFFELVDSTTGLPKTGIVFGDCTGSYVRTRSARSAITMATLASASAAWSSGGFILVDDTNQPGVYRLDVPDAAFATGVEEVVVTILATGCRTVSKGFVLIDWNKQVASIPNVAAAATGGLATVDASNAVKVQSGTGANQISLASGLVTLAAVTHTGAVIPTVTTTTTATNVTTNNDKTGYALSAAGIDALWDEGRTGHVTAGSYGADFNTFLDSSGPSVVDIATAAMTAYDAATYPEPTSVPAATASLPVKIGWLAFLARNKTNVTSTAITFRNDGDTADIATTSHSESAGTYTRNEWS